MSGDAPRVGEIVKVSLPGETPWVVVVAIEADGTWHGRISNVTVAQRSDEDRLLIAQRFGSDKLVPSLHGWKHGDVVCFGRTDRGWEPIETTGGRA
jgi:hypothetical protein